MVASGSCFLIGCFVLCAASAAGCGYLDEDLALSDEEFANSFGYGGGSSSSGRRVTIGCGGFGVGSSGMRGYGGAVSHGSVHRATATPSIVKMSETRIFGRQPTTTVYLSRRDERESDEDAESDRSGYSNKGLHTWGDYVELEMERAELKGD